MQIKAVKLLHPIYSVFLKRECNNPEGPLKAAIYKHK